MVGDHQYIAFLKWCLPRLGLRWQGFRKVRRLVAKRISRRLAELRLADLDAYQALLLREPGEWRRLDAMCRIPISRFYRDRGVFDAIARRLLPETAEAAIARSGQEVHCWSAGCASGEEPYSLALLWHFIVAKDWPSVAFTVVASDVDETMLQRAEIACYAHGSLKDIPSEWIRRAFTRSETLLCLRPEFRRSVQFALQDIRRSMPDGPFDLILCRNLVFTYFDEVLQRQLLSKIAERLVSKGFLVLGAHEKLPAESTEFAAAIPGLPIYRKGTEGLGRLRE